MSTLSKQQTDTKPNSSAIDLSSKQLSLLLKPNDSFAPLDLTKPKHTMSDPNMSLQSGSLSALQQLKQMSLPFLPPIAVNSSQNDLYSNGPIFMPNINAYNHLIPPFIGHFNSIQPTNNGIHNDNNGSNGINNHLMFGKSPENNGEKRNDNNSDKDKDSWSTGNKGDSVITCQSKNFLKKISSFVYSTERSIFLNKYYIQNTQNELKLKYIL
jgi:hypothetical protein